MQARRQDCIQLCRVTAVCVQGHLPVFGGLDLVWKKQMWVSRQTSLRSEHRGRSDQMGKMPALGLWGETEVSLNF